MWRDGFERRYASGKYELFSNRAAELVRLKVDVIVTPGNAPATLAAKSACPCPRPLSAGCEVGVRYAPVRVQRGA
jgi:hypothetical protein